MHEKSQVKEFTWETYLDHVDEFLDDEECCSSDQMRNFGQDLNGVLLQSVSLACLLHLRMDGCKKNVQDLSQFNLSAEE